MTNIDIDLSNYKDKVGQRVSPGRYRVVVDDAELDKSSAGNQMINLWLRVQGGEFDGSTIIDRLVLTEKSLFRVVGFMSALGLATPKKRLRVNIGTWVGKVLDVDVDDGDPYNGRVKSEVRGYLRPPKSGNGQAADLDTSGLEEFVPEENVTTEPTEAVMETDVPQDVDLDSLNLS